MFDSVTHILFDMDGLLINTEDLYTVAFQNVVSKYGKDYTYDLKMQVMGFQTQETAKKIIEALQLPLTVEEFCELTEKQFKALFPDTQLMPGAKKLLKHLYKHKIPMALATSSSFESYELKVNKNHKELFSLFECKVYGSSEPEVKKGKPNPDIFLVAASRLSDKPKPEKCLVFEDSLHGVTAAKAAGMQVVMVPDNRLDRTLTKDATLVINSLEEFKPELFGLPPFDS